MASSGSQKREAEPHNSEPTSSHEPASKKQKISPTQPQPFFESAQPQSARPSQVFNPSNSDSLHSQSPSTINQLNSKESIMSVPSPAPVLNGTTRAVSSANGFQPEAKREEQVGIKCYVKKTTRGITGTLKMRYVHSFPFFHASILVGAQLPLRRCLFTFNGFCLSSSLSPPLHIKSPSFSLRAYPGLFCAFHALLSSFPPTSSAQSLPNTNSPLPEI